MTVSPVQVDQPDGVSRDGHQQALQDESRLLFDQLHIVQSELERLYYQNQAQIPPSTIIYIAPVDKSLIDVRAENLRQQALLKAQGELHALQARYALSSQLGEILIHGTRSVRSMLSLPRSLLRAWQQNRHEAPPKSLGGKRFDRVVEAFSVGGEQAVEALLARASVSTAVQASAWTALARGQMQRDAALAAAFARRAYLLDPRSFRQKWLAFRLHEAGELLEAEALIQLLPESAAFSDSEERQLTRLKEEAKQDRLDRASEALGYAEHQNKVNRQWQDLADSRDALAVQLAVLRFQLDSALNELAQFKRDKNLTDSALQEEQQAALRSKSLVTSLQQEHDKQKALAKQWFDQCVVLQHGVAELTQARDEQARLAGERLAECEQLKLRWATQVEGKSRTSPRGYRRSSGRKS